MEPLLSKRDLNFLLYDVLDAKSLTEFGHFQDHNVESFDAFIETAEKIAEKYFLTHNAKADQQEPHFDGDSITIIPEVKIALEQYVEAGFIGAKHSFDDGGMQLPSLIASACQSYFFSANPSTSGYPFLTTAASNLIAKFGSESQKQRYLQPLLEGEFFGTMALTEPEVGSSLGDLKTTATPTSNGSYLIKGQKMFISGGDHQLSTNIIHLVLARIKNAPPGVKGISLFIVPKFLVDDQGKNLSKNDVALSGLLHKMGYRGTTSTVLNFGEQDNCHGFLIGEAHQGLKYMFMMMNEARIGVGLGAAMIGYRGYLSSLDYARSRPQGRLPSNRDPLSKPVMLIEHADIRRMLLAQKSYVEGSLALCLYASKLMDISEVGDSVEHKTQAGLLLDLLTPIVKSFPSSYGTKANDLAIQVLGGSGYTREYPVEQCYRDNRLNPIHEGTHGIQALDLLGRKLWLNSGQGLELLMNNIHLTIKQAHKYQSLTDLADLLSKATSELSDVTENLGVSLTKKGPDITLANASLYLDCFGKVVVAWLWLEQAVVATTQLVEIRDNPEQEDFLKGKCQTAEYYISWELPTIYHPLSLLNELNPVCFDMENTWF
ncbi:MAG: acyl-CoA dehydrogenase [Gammaproteobacteria bacterium]|nr:MAG: acyl-CoA dehydrogenase [Gammaproteobacteria bacterium]